MKIIEYFKQLLNGTPDNYDAIEYEGDWWTWAKVRSCTNMLENALIEAGIKSSERIGLILENRPEHIATTLKLLTKNMPIVVLNPLQPTSRLIENITRLDIKIIIAGTALLADKKLLEEIIKNRMIFKLSQSGETFLISNNNSNRTNKINDQNIAIEMPTSGTTGTPKQVKLTYQQLDNAVTASVQVPKDKTLLMESVSLVSMPMVHISGLWGVLSALYTGRKIVLMSKFALMPWIEAVERYKIRATFLVPTALYDLLNSNVPPEKLHSLKIITTGSTSCSPKLIEQFFLRYGIRILATYGATEFAGAIAGWDSALHEKWWNKKAGSAGKTYSGIKIRITGESGAELSAGQKGYLEVLTKPNWLVNQYEWVRTNDLANIDSDGFLWILGRKDNIITRGGFKIQTEKIKNLLETHPSVKEAAVIAIPDTRLGSIPIAVIEILPKYPVPSIDELVNLCRRELLPYERPSHLLIVDKLPRTPSSKIDQVELLNMTVTSLKKRPIANNSYQG
ncbi:acyl-CoA synthetase /AMP-acid ligase II [Xenorhabdus mauleonii]|uniref:Acyl-CoA synthetase (AMP-forming)/AMP-acid ligase II n=2 Tax=Xenorhabdus mauleonii TaxID=351675 RepID=A0A1I3SUY5_9GAMM|nr:acyl-CoA synthetase /AMP-acid ligase II [Xenorhabdus mauleonii]SFJ62615.1 Acyl-CoA synthetase (AMP-forming)/AMP-acid ligase II [Xenorhabdus mauleonii]